MNSPDRAACRVAALVDRFGLPSNSHDQLLALLALVSGDPLAPTTVRDPTQVVDDHLADALVALELEAVRGARSIADIGSGAGFPGLPLAIALPDATVFLVESSARKCEFLHEAVTVIDAQNVVIVRARAEEWPDGAGGQDLVTARALAPLSVVAEYAAPLLRVGGSLVVWRGRRDAEAEAQAAAAAAILGLGPVAVPQVFPYPSAQNRYLHLMSKVRDTPRRFPRRAGVALKRPLGVSASGPEPTDAGASDRTRR